jgi:5-oxoprolinase (ATP-hydrolysing) subunit A
MQRGIDLNADVGEGVGDDSAMLAIVSSVNVACGFHAGDAATMRAVCEEAVERGVSIGAQPSYRDREGFGRRPVEIGFEDLVADLAEQIEALEAAASDVGGVVRYLKPHGALYNRAADGGEQAAAVVEACRRYALPVLGLPRSAMLDLAIDAGIATGREFFADRAYDAHGRLVSRVVPGSVLDDPATIVDRIVRLLADGTVISADGAVVDVSADSICVHGDTPGAVHIAGVVRHAIERHGATVKAFW